jgi:DnaJ-class molecular chaperone
MLSVESIPRRGADLYREVVLSQEEAAAGTGKEIKYQRDKEKKRLVFKVPAGITDSTRIRLKGMGLNGITPGDLYVTIRIRS